MPTPTEHDAEAEASGSKKLTTVRGRTSSFGGGSCGSSSEAGSRNLLFEVTASEDCEKPQIRDYKLARASDLYARAKLGAMMRLRSHHERERGCEQARIPMIREE